RPHGRNILSHVPLGRGSSYSRAHAEVTMRSTYPSNSIVPLPYHRRGRLTIVVLLAAVIGGCMSSMLPPANLDYGRIRRSESGLYRGAIKPEGDSIPQGKLQRWTLHLEAVDGAPVDAATIAVDGGMPQHGHGLPTKPMVTRQLGNGDYVV